MSNPETVFARPWWHHLLIMTYVAAPFANILLVRLFLDVPLSVILRRLGAGFGIPATIWLFTAPLVGVSLYLVRRLSWYVFLAHGSLILVDFLVKWASRPMHYLQTVPSALQVLILAGNLALVVLIGCVVRKDFRSPYLDVLRRRWREREHVPIQHTVLLDGVPRTMSDLTTGGCFIVEEGMSRTTGSRVHVSFSSDTLRIECTGEIVRRTAEGYGIVFVDLAPAGKIAIARLLKNRFSSRLKVDLPCSLVFADTARNATILDLSPGGCYVRAETTDVRRESRVP